MQQETNIFRQAILAREMLYGLWNGIPGITVAQILAGTGYDFICIDAEHSPYDVPMVLTQLMAMEPYPVSPLVRLPVGDPVLIKQYLDIGAKNLLIPMVESKAQAEMIVSSMLYPPRGIRGVGAALARASRWNQIPNYIENADEGLCLIVQVESVAGLKNLDAICGVPGVHGVFIGPADLAASMGFPGKPTQASVVDTVKDALNRIRSHDLSAGVLALREDLIRDYKEAGANLIGVGLDTLLLSHAARALRQNIQ